MESLSGKEAIVITKKKKEEVPFQKLGGSNGT